MIERSPNGTARQTTERDPIPVRWVDTNKGDGERPQHRSRLVAQQARFKGPGAVFAAIPQSELSRPCWRRRSRDREDLTLALQQQKETKQPLPPAGQDWERGDFSLASRLLSQNREARCDGSLFYHSSKEDSSRPFDQAQGNSMREGFFHGSHTRKSSREQISSQERELIHQIKKS